jgi:hypothetical protein
MWKHRFGVLVCHRRLGKTVMAVNHLIRSALTCTKEAPRFGYLAPTYRQGKAIAWDYFKRFSEQINGQKPNESELRIDFAQNDSQVRIFGADSPDSLRGLYFDGIVPDEYGLMPPNIYSEVLSPTLVDRQGWALFCGTPNGRNQFYDAWKDAEGKPGWFRRMYKASETGIIPPEELERAREEMTEDEYAQEYECSFEAAVKGAIFGKEMAKAQEEGRITRVPYEPILPVDTTWDLGVNAPTAIWFSQTTRSGEVRLIDYHEASGEGLPYYVNVLRGKPYVYGQHWAPHDIQVREFSSGRSRLEAALALGIRFNIVPKVQSSARGEVDEGIHAARLLLSRCWFDAVKCEAGIEALKHYRRAYNRQLDEFKATPVPDQASHGSDAFRYLSVWHKDPIMPGCVAVDMPAVYNWF